MVWLILCPILVILLIFFLIRKTFENEVFAALYLVFFTLVFIGTAVEIATGLEIYPQLLSKKAGVLALQSEVETVRDAYYQESKEGSLIGGSLDNLKQSTILSEYIKEYAKKKAAYNSQLAVAKVRKTTKVFFWLGNGFFISEKVLEMEEI